MPQDKKKPADVVKQPKDAAAVVQPTPIVAMLYDKGGKFIGFSDPK